MQDGIDFYFLSGISICLVVFSIRQIMIGLNKLNHPMYDNNEKRKYILKRGVISLIISTICGAFFCILSIMIILMK
jgi:hypothetical protein